MSIYTYYVKNNNGELIANPDINKNYIPVCNPGCPSCTAVEVGGGYLLYDCEGGEKPISTEPGWPCLPAISYRFKGLFT